MSGKKLIVIVFLSLNIACYSQSKADRDASFMNYGQYIQPFIRLQHDNFYRGELNSLNKDLIVDCSFNIDTGGKIINYKLLGEKQETAVAAYIKNLLYLTDGRWLPEVQNCNTQISQEIFVRFFLHSKDIGVEKRMEEKEKELQRMYSDPNAKASDDLAESGKPNHIFVFLSY